MNLFLHAARQLFGNFGAALKIGGVILLVYLGFIAWFGAERTTWLVHNERVLRAWIEHNLLWLLPSSTILFVYALTTVIVWHRFVLLSEAATPLNLKLFQSTLWAYIWASIKLIIVAMVAGFLLALVLYMLRGVIAALVQYTNFTAAVMIGLLLQAIILWFVLRMGAALPGVAAGKKIGLFDAFAETRSISRNIFNAALLSSVITVALEYGLDVFAFRQLGVNYIYLSAVLYWVWGMLQISLLTTIYGHAVEGRPLNA